MRLFNILLFAAVTLPLLVACENSATPEAEKRFGWASPIDARYEKEYPGIYPKYLEARELLGKGPANKEALQEANLMLMEIVQEHPDFAPAYLQLARFALLDSHTMGGVFDYRAQDAAATHARKALSLEPGYADAYVVLAEVDHYAESPMHAFTNLVLASEIGTESPWFAITFADVVRRYGSNDIALDHYTQIIEADWPGDQVMSAAYSGAIPLLAARGEIEKADAWFQELLQLESDRAHAYYRYANFTLYETPDYEKAISLWREYIDMAGVKPSQTNLAIALYAKWANLKDDPARLEDAQAAFHEAESLEPDLQRDICRLFRHEATRQAGEALQERYKDKKDLLKYC